MSVISSGLRHSTLLGKIDPLQLPADHAFLSTTKNLLENLDEITTSFSHQRSVIVLDHNLRIYIV